ncbi:MAG: hypothetical protein ABIQ96_12615 [Luteolibacter sp.]
MKALFTLMLATSATDADTLQRTDLAKLRDPALRDAEVSRLAECGKGSKVLTGYRLLTANQKDGSPPLLVLCASHDYRFPRDLTPFGEYKLENPEELFGNIARPIPFSLEPNLDLVRDSQLLIFDSEGQEVRPFKGNNLTSKGYYFDFDHDGILDRADSTNFALDQSSKDTAEVFKLQSIEPNPRTLLEVIFNWHPSSAADSNDWTFTCFDENQDGIPEIGFGPDSATSEPEQRKFIFRWNPTTRSFSAGEIPAHSHVRVMTAGDTLASIGTSGGLGYPLLKDSSAPEKDDEPIPPSPQGPYVFHSFKDKPAAELAAFFQGKPRHDSWSGPEDSFPNRLPEKFWDLTPKQAAIALAEANRTPTHRAKWKLALDDRGGIAPPKSGWLTLDWGSSSCYSYSSHLFALRFGVPDPGLTVFEYNSIGVVGRNPWADQPAHNVRVIQLSEQESRFLADTVFWLDRIRTFSPEKTDPFQFGRGTTADGRATACLFPDGAAPSKLAKETVWATFTISGSWDDAYSKTTFVNLAEFLIADNFPATLGERWNVAPEIGRHSLITPTNQRLTPRVDDDNRQKLSDAFAAVLKQHARDPIPAAALGRLVQAAGDERLTDLIDPLRKLSATLPPANAEDQEFETLEKAYANDYKDNPRLNELRDKREFLPAAILRNPLADTLTKLRLSGNAAELKSAVNENGPQSQWALNQFRRLDPNAWSEIIAGQFKKADVESRRIIFQTLAAGNPTAAKEMIADITPAEHLDLIIEIARYHQTQDVGSLPKDLPVLMTLVRDRSANFIRRGSAMELLSEIALPPDQLKEFTTLLVAKIRTPQQGEYGMNTLDSAITAISRLPEAASHLDVVTSAPGLLDQSFSPGFAAVLRMTRNHPDRKKFMTDFIRPRFQKGNGMMNDIFVTALAHDLRELAPEIATFASEGTAVADGDGANYSGGGFKTPAGRRYHIAREITALWSESDPVTVGRLWVRFIAAHPYQFSEGNPDQSLRELATRQVNGLPKEQLRKEIDSAIELIPISKNDSALEIWLRKLAEN